MNKENLSDFARIGSRTPVWLRHSPRTPINEARESEKEESRK